MPFSPEIAVSRPYTLILLVAAAVRFAGAETISDADRAYLVSHLEMTREFVRDTGRGLTKEQWLYHTAPRRWSIAQCIDHLAASEEYVLRMVRERLLSSNEPLINAFPSVGGGRKRVADPPRRMAHFEDAIIIRWMTDRTSASSTPVEQRPPIEEVAPSETIDRPQATLDRFLRVRAATIDYVRTTRDDLRGHFSQSPMEGFPNVPFTDGYQWLLRMSAHTERHLIQVHEIRRSSGYPGRDR
jgi:hypothetical protein